MATGLRNYMPWQRYDIRNRSGEFVERHWHPINAPILDPNGEVKLIIHHVADVTFAAKRLTPQRMINNGEARI
jgi:hypothetical protein